MVDWKCSRQTTIVVLRELAKLVGNTCRTWVLLENSSFCLTNPNNQKSFTGPSNDSRQVHMVSNLFPYTLLDATVDQHEHTWRLPDHRVVFYQWRMIVHTSFYRRKVPY